MQVSYPILGYHVTHQTARCHHARARVEHGNNPRNRTVLCSGGDRNDRLAPFGTRGAAQKVYLAADSAVKTGSDRIRAYLSGKVDLQGSVDGYHVVVARDESRIICICGRVELEHRIVVDKVEDFPRSQDETRNDLAWLEVLARAGQDAGLDEWNQAVGNHLTVSAQILAINEELQHRIRYAADPGLQHRAVFDEVGNVAGDG